MIFEIFKFFKNNLRREQKLQRAYGNSRCLVEGVDFGNPKKKRKNIFASKTNDKSCQNFFFGNPAPILSRSEEVVHLRKKFHRSTVGFTSNGGVFDKRGAGFQKSKCYFHFGCSSSKHKNLDNLLLENFVGIACASTARSQKFGPYFVRKFFRDSLCLDGQVN